MKHACLKIADQDGADVCEPRQPWEQTTVALGMQGSVRGELFRVRIAFAPLDQRVTLMIIYQQLVTMCAALSELSKEGFHLCSVIGRSSKDHFIKWERQV